MLRLCICDDRKEDIDSVKVLISKFSERYPEHPVRVSYFDNTYDLLETLQKSGGYDLYLLDIIMPHISGIELAEKIRQRKERSKLLFLTASREYGIEAIGVKASGYLVKPIREQEFFDAVLSCIEEMAPENNPYLMVKTKLGLTRVQISELMRIESFNHVRELTLRNGGSLETTTKLSELKETLKDYSCFISPHRAYLVNMEHVEAFRYEKLALRDGTILSISEAHRANVRSRFWEWGSE